MNIIEKNRLDISELKIKFNWNQKKLRTHFPDEDVFRRLENPKKDSSTTLKIISIFCIFLLSFFVVPYIPMNSIKNSLNTEVQNASFYIGIAVIGFYLYWVFSRIWTRRKKAKEKSQEKYSKKQLFSLSDLIPFIILVVVYIIHFRPDSYSNGNNFNNDPFGYLLKYEQFNSESTTIYSEFFSFVTILVTLYLIVGGCLLVIYQAWLKSPCKFQKLLENLLKEKVTYTRKSKTINEEKTFFRKILKIGGKNREEIDCYVQTITPEVKITDLWQFFNPDFIRNFFVGLGIGFFLISWGCSVIEQVLYDPYYQTENNSFMLYFAISISILFIFGCSFIIKILIIQPIMDYYRLKKHVIKEIEIRISDIYKKVGTDTKDDSTILETLFLKECLNNHKKLPLLPLDQPVSSLVLILPYITLILSNFL